MADNIEREILKKEFPPNNQTQKEVKIEAPKVQKVVTGKVKKQKRSFSKRFAETFLEDDTKSVGQYILHDVLIPAAKAMISDMVGGGLDMMLFGERRRGAGYNNTSLRRDGSKTIVNYAGISRDSRDPRDRRREISKVGRARHDFDEVVIDNRGEAEDVLAHLFDLVVEYGQATVADFYDLCDVETNFTDNKYGWTDLRGAHVSRVRNGYIINLPRAQPVD